MSVCLSVGPSVRLPVFPSGFRVISISVKPIVEFANNSGVKYDKSKCNAYVWRFNIKVKVQGKTLDEWMACPFYNSWGLLTFWNDLTQMLSTIRRWAERMFDQCHFKVIGYFKVKHCRIRSFYIFIIIVGHKITLHKCQVWCVNVQFVCLTIVGSM